MPEYKCKHCNDTGTCATKPGIHTRWACQDCDAGKEPEKPDTSDHSVDAADMIPPCKTCNGTGQKKICGGYRPCSDCTSASRTQSVDNCTDHIVDANKQVPPPEGYETWLDYAVASLTDLALPSSAFADTPPPHRRDMRDAARAELAELRAHANARVNKAWDNGYKTGKCAGAREAKAHLLEEQDND